MELCRSSLLLIGHIYFHSCHKFHELEVKTSLRAGSNAGGWLGDCLRTPAGRVANYLHNFAHLDLCRREKDGDEKACWLCSTSTFLHVALLLRSLDGGMTVRVVGLDSSWFSPHNILYVSPIFLLWTFCWAISMMLEDILLSDTLFLSPQVCRAISLLFCRDFAALRPNLACAKRNLLQFSGNYWNFPNGLDSQTRLSVAYDTSYTLSSF